MQFFFFNDTATTEIYTLSLHDARPIFGQRVRSFRLHLVRRDAAHDQGELHVLRDGQRRQEVEGLEHERHADRKSTRLNSSHANISYAVFCLKKKISLYIVGAS